MAQHFWPYGLPPETGGIALNLAGLGSLCRAVDALHGTSLAPAASAAADLICCSLLLASAFKLLLAPGKIAAELRDPKMCGSHGGLLMALNAMCAELRSWDPAVASMAVHACSGLQLAMLVWYLGWCWHIRSPPVPFWFPATVGVGMSVVAGGAVGMAPALQRFFLLLSCSLCALLWPWIAWRVARSDRIAPAPSVCVLAAPVSLVGLAFFALHDGAAAAAAAARPRVVTAAGALPLARRHHSTAHTIFALSTLAAFATLVAVFRRRAILRRFVQPRRGWAHPEWSGVTFPLVATSIVALRWEASVVRLHGEALWPSVLAVLCALVVVPIDLLFLLALPRWLANGLPPVPEWEEEEEHSVLHGQSGKRSTSTSARAVELEPLDVDLEAARATQVQP